jgi:hypothetical protein
LNERLQNEEKNRLKLESTIVALETELKMVKESSAEALLRMKDQYEQVGSDIYVRKNDSLIGDFFFVMLHLR